jgi:hypothetical protein
MQLTMFNIFLWLFPVFMLWRGKSWCHAFSSSADSKHFHNQLTPCILIISSPHVVARKQLMSCILIISWFHTFP